MHRPLQIPLVVAGQVLGMKSATAAYKHVPDILSVISYGGAKKVVPAQALATKLGVSLETSWATIEALEPLAAETATGLTSRELAERRVAAQEAA